MTLELIATCNDFHLIRTTPCEISFPCIYSMFKTYISKEEGEHGMLKDDEMSFFGNSIEEAVRRFATKSGHLRNRQKHPLSLHTKDAKVKEQCIIKRLNWCPAFDLEIWQVREILTGNLSRASWEGIGRISRNSKIEIILNDRILSLSVNSAYRKNTDVAIYRVNLPMSETEIFMDLFPFFRAIGSKNIICRLSFLNSLSKELRNKAEAKVILKPILDKDHAIGLRIGSNMKVWSAYRF